MHKLLSLLVGGVLALAVAAPSAQALPFTGSLSVAVGTLPPIPLAGGGSGSSVGGGIANITSGGISGTVAVPVINPTFGNFPAFPIVSLKIGTPAGIGTGFTGVAGGAAACTNGGVISGAGISDCAGMFGAAKIGLFGTPNAPFANLTVPLAVLGGGGSFTTMSPLGVNITAVGAGWTTGVAKVIGSTNPTTATLGAITGADLRTAGGAGTVVFVSPLLAITNIAGSTNLGLFGILTLNFVPEPGTLLLLGSGVAGLALLGRRRMNG